MRIGFLYNHDGTHQVPHTIAIASALAARGVEVAILTSSEPQREIAAAMLRPGLKVGFIPLRLGPIARGLDYLLRGIAPYHRLAILAQNRDTLASFDALVVPETTTALLKTGYRMSFPKLIYQPHGAGDGDAGFQPVTRAFDLVLLSGEKLRDRMLALGLIRPGAHAIVGYPKFGIVADAPPRPPLFANGRPTVLYNPHFSPALSSWYSMGPGILRWFAAQDRFNLIFAPHVMLFKRWLHTSLIHRSLSLRPAIPREAFTAPSILIDTGSRKSIDMTYVNAADIYLGDVSSQIYEWIPRPRPAIFLNTHKIAWRSAPAYAHWHLGRVVDDQAGLISALDSARRGENVFEPAQHRAMSNTFSIQDRPAGERAADAILAFLAA